MTEETPPAYEIEHDITKCSLCMTMANLTDAYLAKLRHIVAHLDQQDSLHFAMHAGVAIQSAQVILETILNDCGNESDRLHAIAHITGLIAEKR